MTNAPVIPAANPGLARQRCANHAAREAVSRCVLCSRSFCRECITEHEGRMLCSACLARSAAPGRAARTSGWLAIALSGLAGLLLAWALFFTAANFLARVSAPAPSENGWR